MCVSLPLSCKACENQSHAMDMPKNSLKVKRGDSENLVQKAYICKCKGKKGNSGQNCSHHRQTCGLCRQAWSHCRQTCGDCRYTCGDGKQRSDQLTCQWQPSRSNLQQMRLATVEGPLQRRLPIIYSNLIKQHIVPACCKLPSQS